MGLAQKHWMYPRTGVRLTALTTGRSWRRGRWSPPSRKDMVDDRCGPRWSLRARPIDNECQSRLRNKDKVGMRVRETGRVSESEALSWLALNNYTFLCVFSFLECFVLCLCDFGKLGPYSRTFELNEGGGGVENHERQNCGTRTRSRKSSQFHN